MFVETSRDPDRVRKIEPERTHGEPLVVRRRGRQGREFQHSDRKPMRIFRIKRAQQGPRQSVEKTDHEFSSGSARRRSISSASGFAQRTAVSGSAA